MSNRKKIASIAFTGAAVTAMTALAAAPALAAGSWHVKDFGTGYTGIIKARSKAGTSASLKDTTTNAVLKCKKGIISGSLSKSHSPGSTATLGFLRSTRFSCTGFGGLHFELLGAAFPKVVATTYSFGFGVTTGKLSGNKIRFTLSGTSPHNTCRATISGTSIPMKYHNSPHSLSVNPAEAATLTFGNATGLCLGQFAAGNKAYLHGIFHVSSPFALTISRS